METNDYFCVERKNRYGKYGKCIESLIWEGNIPIPMTFSFNIWNVLCESWVETGRRLEFSNFCSLVSELKGKHVAMLCARYFYRGILEEATPNYVVLSSPHVVEVTGMAQGEKPYTEFSIKGGLVIPITAIEIFTQPKWCFAPICQITKDFHQVSSTGWLSVQKTMGATGQSGMSEMFQSSVNFEAMEEWKEYENTVIEPHKGDRVAVICNRYRYRGNVKIVTDDCIVLEKAFAVEDTHNSKPIIEDWIGSDVFIPRSTIEMICHPKWCEAPLEPQASVLFVA